MVKLGSGKRTKIGFIRIGLIDKIVKATRFSGWQETHSGGREMKQVLRKTLFKYQLHKDEELFDKAYAYISEHY